MGRSVAWFFVGLTAAVVVVGLWLVLGDDQPPVSGSTISGSRAVVASGREPEPARVDEPVRVDEAAPVATSAQAAEPLGLPAAEPAAVAWDGDDPLGLMLHGVVYGPDGLPLTVEHRSVVWTANDGTHRKVRLSDSTYSMAGLRPSKGTLSFEHQGVLPFEQELTITADQHMRRVDIRLECSRVLCVKLLDPSGQRLGTNLFGVLATPEAPGVVPGAVPGAAPGAAPGAPLRPTGRRMLRHNIHGTWIPETNAWSERVVASGCDGMLDLHSPLPLWVSLLNRHVVLATQLVESDADEIVFVLTPEQAMRSFGSVRIQIVDAESGAPVPGARVALGDNQGGGFGRAVDAQGLVEWQGQAPGLFNLDVRAQGYETVDETILIEPGERKDLGQRALHPATEIRGRIVDGSGQPLGARVAYAPADWHHDRVGRRPRMQIRSGADGEFTISRLGRRRYTVWSPDSGELMSPIHIVDTTNGDVDGVTLVLQPPTKIIFHRRWPDDVSHEVTMLDERGLALWRSVLSGKSSWGRSYLPGKYELRIGAGAREVPFTVGTSRTEVTLPLP